VFGLVFVEDPQPVAQVDVRGDDRRHLAGPTAGLLQGEQEVPEAVVLGVAVEDPPPFLAGQEALAGPGGAAS
jgi:hypothetical protein